MSEGIKHSEFRIKPRFTLTSRVSVENICHRFKVVLITKRDPFSGKVRLGYISLYPSEKHRHYWSPHLSVTIEVNQDNPEETILRGLYGPAPSVWTLFVFIYAVIAFSIVIVSVIGFANRSIGESGAILWALPVLIMLLVSIFATSYYGQQRGVGQLHTMDQFFMDVLDDVIKNDGR